MCEPDVRVTVTREREFRAFAELSYAHWVILEKAKVQRDGWSYECLTANLLAAFKVEAYLNHIGPVLVPDWKEREPWHRKLKRIWDELSGSTITDSEVAFIEELFTIRNELAHGRTEWLHEDGVEQGPVEELRQRRPQVLCEQRATLEFAEKAYDQTESLIRRMHTAAGRDESELSRGGHSYVLKRL